MTKCKCRFCSFEIPRFTRLLGKLKNKKDRSDLEDMFNKYIHVSDDLNHAEAKLDGSWPNWEWIKAEKEKRGLI